MTPKDCLYLVVTAFAVLGWQSRVHAEGDVTVLPTSAVTTNAPPQSAVAPEGVVVVHKSLHKKKPDATATAQTQATGATNPSSATKSTTNSSAVVPTVETGLPVAHYPGMGSPITGVSTYTPIPAPPSSIKPAPATATHQPYFASAFSPTPARMTTSATGNYSYPSHTSTSPPSDFVFTNFSTRKTKNFYPWKTGIITTIFWIGEGGSNISSTTNIGSAWDENWRSTNRGSDDPNDRNGFASADHASTVNPFYVALPFNDLAYPDKAREWVPRSWHRPPEDGKQVSACKDRWVWIKNANGRSCFAQWEDVGPLRSDHAEYVFGDERPDTYTRAGLDVSPAVADYLGIRDNSRAITSWRFVDAEDVPPGQWLKYDEQAVLFIALHQLKNTSPTSDLPIQKASEPIDDPENINSNKKKVDQSKG